MNLDAVTIEDCIENYHRKNQAVILVAGKVVGFVDDRSYLSSENIVRYTALLDKRMDIVMHSGKSWKPAYGLELQKIDKEIAELRLLIEAERERR